MRVWIAAAAALSAGACAFEPPEPPELNQAECYTVDIFDDRHARRKILPPDAAVQPQWAAFSGVWGQGAWDGGQCHEIHVTQVFADGSAVVLDTVAPYRNLRASAFRRPAMLTEDGRLVIISDGTRREYRIEDGLMYGTRTEPGGRTAEVILTPQS
ncbi:MAG: hypothetical protein AAGK98_10585 [Pseudomonadota bacterium]